MHKKIHIGVAWPYASGLFHLGNFYGSFLPADIFSRFQKLQGNDVLMVSGSDTYGTPITVKADQEKITPEAVAQKYHQLITKYLQKLDIDFTLFSSTATNNHCKVTQQMFLQLQKNGFIIKQINQQLYSEQAGKFLQDRYVEGECPFCHSKDARGDQCEQCGRQLDANELINPVSKLDKTPLILKETEHYFLDLSKIEPNLKKWVESKTDLRKWIKNETLGWIKEGLKPRAITRDMTYGIPIPVDQIPSKELIANIENKVFYVWFEAVIGYLSASIEYFKNQNKPEKWKDFFYNNQAESYYFVGQDNLVFHTLNWPAQLMAYDSTINLPTNVFVTKFIKLEGKKWSKSKNWFIQTEYLTENYNIDVIRFYLVYIMTDHKESNFQWTELMLVNNSELIGKLGNFINRVLSFTNKNFGSDLSIFKDCFLDKKIKTTIDTCFQKTEKYLKLGKFKKSVEEILNLCKTGNVYLEENKFWELIKTDSEQCKTVLFSCFCLINNLKILLYPFIPHSAEKINQMLGFSQTIKSTIQLDKNRWQTNNNFLNNQLSEITILFTKIEPKQIQSEIKKLQKK